MKLKLIDFFVTILDIPLLIQLRRITLQMWFDIPRDFYKIVNV